MNDTASDPAQPSIDSDADAIIEQAEAQCAKIDEAIKAEQMTRSLANKRIREYRESRKLWARIAKSAKGPKRKKKA